MVEKWQYRFYIDTKWMIFNVFSFRLHRNCKNVGNVGWFSSHSKCFNKWNFCCHIPIKTKDPPWFAVQMGSVADSVAAKIRIFIDNTNFLEYFF